MDKNYETMIKKLAFEIEQLESTPVYQEFIKINNILTIGGQVHQLIQDKKNGIKMATAKLHKNAEMQHVYQAQQEEKQEQIVEEPPKEEPKAEEPPKEEYNTEMDLGDIDDIPGLPDDLGQ